MKKLLCSLAFLPFLMPMAGCSGNIATETQAKPTSEATTTSIATDSTTTTTGNTTNDENPKISILLSNEKTINCELYPEVAPISVNNFLSLVDSHYYDGVVFHRVIESFMIQTGGYYLDGNTVYQKESVPCIKGEFELNGVENNILHEPGVLSMARATPYDSGSSQFFICVETCTWLDKNYAAFGKTIDEESLNTAIEISKIPTVNIGGGLTDFPYQPVSIVSITRITES